MAISAGIAVAVGVGGALIQGNQLKQKQKGDQAALQRDLEASIANAPKPPDTAKLNADAARQAAAASAAQRRAAPAGGYASTILTGGQGAPPVPTVKKALLGQ